MDYPSDPSVRLHEGKFTDGVPLSDIPASRDPASHINAITDELLNIIALSGEDADEANLTQIASTIQQLISDSAGLGVNQTWQELSASRSVGVTYTNTSGKPICLSIISADVSGNNCGVYLEIDANEVVRNAGEAPNIIPYQTAFAIVPNNSTYKVDLQSSDSLNLWWELR